MTPYMKWFMMPSCILVYPTYEWDRFNRITNYSYRCTMTVPDKKQYLKIKYECTADKHTLAYILDLIRNKWLLNPTLKDFRVVYITEDGKGTDLDLTDDDTTLMSILSLTSTP